MTARVKICGITTVEAVTAAADADYLGFIFFQKSPRNVTPAQAATLVSHSDIPSVAVMVDPDDDLLHSLFKAFSPDYIQLHGNESVQRIAAIKKQFKTPVIKAFQIHNAADIAAAKAYENIVDIVMFDAKVLKGLPGGNGVSFDWKLLAGYKFNNPWFLSGGLNASNVEEALRISGATMVDVSSGVESRPGLKDPLQVHAFIQKVRNLSL